jgi:RecA-family ATPase
MKNPTDTGNTPPERPAIVDAVDREIRETKQGKAVKGDELLNKNVEFIPTLIDPIFQKTGLVAVGGSSDVGKSTLLRQLAIAIATRQDTFLGFTLHPAHSKAMYISTEDDEFAISYLLNRYNKVADYPVSDYSNLRYIFDVTALIGEVDSQLTAEPADIVIVDAFTDLYSGQLNEANKVRSFLNDFSQLAVKHETLFVFLHHTGKRTDNEPPSKHNLLGSQAFEAKMRCVIELREDKHDNTKRHLCIVKGNYLPKEDKTESYVLNFEDMLFTSTGTRAPHSDLITGTERRDLQTEAREMSATGLSQIEISKKLGVSQPTIYRWLLHK